MFTWEDGKLVFAGGEGENAARNELVLDGVTVNNLENPLFGGKGVSRGKLVCSSTIQATFF